MPSEIGKRQNNSIKKNHKTIPKILNNEDQIHIDNLTLRSINTVLNVQNGVPYFSFKK